ncbi:MAG: GNAT family N-acetyltransferase [Moorea sp. SIO3G5]|nr:GNAT family N-acetyltransferase [Moorena sp. SIO3G5]
MYELTGLDKFGQAFFYQSLTFPLFRSKLRTVESEESIVAIGAFYLNKPVGLVLAEISKNCYSAEVLSLFVKPNYRGQGIGTALLTRIEKVLSLRGCQEVELIYTTGRSGILELEYLLRKCNWSPPESRRLICQSTTDKIAKAPWMQLSMSSSYQIFPWIEITQAERRTIEEQQQQHPWIDPDLVPWKYEKELEPLNSLGLRYRGEVVGWVITHRIAPDTIRYSSMFVRKDLQKMAIGMTLVVNAIKLQAQVNIPNYVCSVQITNTAMSNFVNKHMSPYLTSFEESRGSFKALRKPWI